VVSQAEPTVVDLVRTALDAAISDAQAATGRSVVVLDAGCGRASPLRQFRARIGRFVGADIHEPSEPLAYLDEFMTVDLCAPSPPFEPGTFDVILMNFTLEHFDDPAIVLGHLRRSLRPGGRLVATTVNRRHPFVRAYLSLPSALRSRAQRWIKSTPADAHRLVGACNDPVTIRRMLEGAGFIDNRLLTVSHLRLAWGRRRPTRWIGRIGDALVAGSPGRRSTIVAIASAPAATGQAA
jgi:SAM-dependent methyltransferase